MKKNKYCCFCGLINPNGNHIYVCKYKPENLIDKKEIKFKYLEKNYPDICTFDFLNKFYTEDKKSYVDLQEQYFIDFKSITFLLDYFKITVRKHAESGKLAQRKIQVTCLDKYGATNVLSKNTVPFNKKNKTVKEKYGVNNIFQTENVILKISDKSKNDLSRQSKISKLNKRIYKVLIDNNIEFEKEFYLKNDIENFNKKYCFYDIKINDVLFEINGCYFHANPNTYFNLETKFKKHSTKEEIWLNDSYKYMLAVKNKYSIVVLWEYWLKTKTDKEIYEFIKNCINKKSNITQE